jgi:CheY-like chemotaxis protein
MELSTIKILLVEDDDIDAATVMRGLSSAKIANPVVRARDGIEALEILKGTNGREKLQSPYLLLVDIRMPRLDGLGLIREVRNTPSLQRTVIFVLTTSDSDRDRAAAYDGHVAGYILKSHTNQQFLQLARMLEYYLLIVSPPPVLLCAALASPHVARATAVNALDALGRRLLVMCLAPWQVLLKG